MTINLSIVIPVYNEAEVLDELVMRCREAAKQTKCNYEIILIDDYSQDETPTRLLHLGSKPDCHWFRNEQNLGQLRATKIGLKHARGEMIVVLDGDLQDPPELIPQLIERLKTAPASEQVVFAVKDSRKDPQWFLYGQSIFHFLQSRFGKFSIPYGAGSFCAMHRSIAENIANLDFHQGNLATLIASLEAKTSIVYYEKQARYDGQSRVGFRLLVEEALTSLAITGVLSRFLWLLSAVSLFTGIAFAILMNDGKIYFLLIFVIAAVATGLGGSLISLAVKRRLDPSVKGE